MILTYVFIVFFGYLYNMLKYLQRVPLGISIINWHYLYQDAPKTWVTSIGHSATLYHSFITLPYALPYIFSQFNIDRP